MEDISRDYNCNNRLERSLRMLQMETGCPLEQGDGYPYYFFSEGVGATMPPMALQQILCLQHLLHHPVKAEHMTQNEQYIPKFWEGDAKILEHVLHRIPIVPEREGVQGQLTVDAIRGRQISNIPIDAFVNFAATDDSEHTLVAVPNATIICAPVIVSYTHDKSGKTINKCVWAVVLRPIRVYDVTAHLRSFLHTLQTAKKDTVQGEAGILYNFLYNLGSWRQYLYNLPENARSFQWFTDVGNSRACQR